MLRSHLITVTCFKTYGTEDQPKLFLRTYIDDCDFDFYFESEKITRSIVFFFVFSIFPTLKLRRFSTQIVRNTYVGLFYTVFFIKRG